MGMVFVKLSYSIVVVDVYCMFRFLSSSLKYNDFVVFFNFMFVNGPNFFFFFFDFRHNIMERP